MDDIARRIQEEIDRQGLSARALSLKAGLSERHVGKILERGSGGGAEGSTLLKIAAALGVSVQWLMTGAGTPAEGAPANDSPRPELRDAQGFSEALPRAMALRPNYDATIWELVASTEPISVIPMSPELVAQVADIVFRLGPTTTARR